jgi:hypothetical protein
LAKSDPICEVLNARISSNLATPVVVPEYAGRGAQGAARNERKPFTSPAMEKGFFLSDLGLRGEFKING